jgi:hypothetical protein
MALLVFKDGILVQKYSATEGSISFNEWNEKHKPETSLYNVRKESKGLSKDEP